LIHSTSPVFVVVIVVVLWYARQELYHLRHDPNSFCLVVFLCLGQAGPQFSCICFPLSWDDRHMLPTTMPSFLLVKMRSYELLPWTKIFCSLPPK
jgi:hypothetical protein